MKTLFYLLVRALVLSVAPPYLLFFAISGLLSKIKVGL